MREPEANWNSVEIQYNTAKQARDDAVEDAKKDYDNPKDKAAAEDRLKGLEKALDSITPLYNAFNEAEDARKELKALLETDKATQSGSDENAKAKSASDLAQANGKYAKMKNAAAYVEMKRSEVDLKEALEDMYRYEGVIREAQDTKDTKKEQEALRDLEATKTKWQAANRAFQTFETQESVQSLEADGIKTMKTAIDGHLKSLDSEIRTLQAQLDSTGAGLANAPDVIMGVAKDKTLIRASDDTTTRIGATTAAPSEESADVWTKVAFTVGSQSDTSSTTESNISGSVNLEVGKWLASVKASSSFSSSSKKVESAMSSCSVGGSFSAMVVNIKRPWLHSDLFQDFDIDISEDTKLSPGAKEIKQWVENGDVETGANKRTEYGKFPAYPTAFIVAADTVLKVFKSSS